MSITEKLLSIVAPHHCMLCGAEDAVVCAWCLPDFAAHLPERCYRCKSATKDSRVCKKCRRLCSMKHVWVRTEYENAVKQLIHDFKFERKQAAAEPIARLMAEALPFLPPDTIVTHVPTATSRARKRGYDHAELLAQALAYKLGLRHERLLSRINQTRQVGSKRAKRLEQMQGAFRPAHEKELQDATILLVDDLTTTGATLESAAKCLRAAGSKTINAVVFAQRQ